jgi:hypothetical protein
MTSTDNVSGVERANETRNSYGSLLDYYYERPASTGNFKIGLTAGTVPSEEQAEALKAEIKEALQIQDVLANLSPEEKAEMEKMAQFSRGKRGKGNQATGQTGSSS